MFVIARHTHEYGEDSYLFRTDSHDWLFRERAIGRVVEALGIDYAPEDEDEQINFHTYTTGEIPKVNPT